MPKIHRRATMPTLKERVREFLRAKDLTQGDLAKRVGISAPHLSLILKGHDSPSLAVAVKLETVTGIPARAFAERERVA